MLNQKLWNEIEERKQLVNQKMIYNKDKLNELNNELEKENFKTTLKAIMAFLGLTAASALVGGSILYFIGNFSRSTIYAVFGIISIIAIPSIIFSIKSIYRKSRSIKENIIELETIIKNEEEKNKEKQKEKLKERKLDLKALEKELDNLSTEELIDIVNKFLDRDKSNSTIKEKPEVDYLDDEIIKKYDGIVFIKNSTK